MWVIAKMGELKEGVMVLFYDGQLDFDNSKEPFFPCLVV